MIKLNKIKGFIILTLLIPEERSIIDSLSFPIVFKTKIDEIKRAKGNICERILGMTDAVRLKKRGMLAPLIIASSSIPRTWVNQARESIAIQTTKSDIVSFLNIYLSILAITVRLYTS